ncbi:MAG: SRPBCC domain-containing protein [Balneolaceae bacterium]|nr:SRPBCC domain-containing protein [Balneolaceae bacterium]
MSPNHDKYSILIQVVLSVSPKVAWNILTQNQYIAHWWGKHVQIEPKSLGTFHEEWNDGGKQLITSGTITSFNPPFVLSMTWRDKNWPGYTTVTFLLIDEDNSTRLHLIHSGWDTHPPHRQKKLMDAHTQGWRHYLHQFAAYTKSL